MERAEQKQMQLRNAELVHEWSDGRLGYAHVKGMSQPSLDEFERDLFAATEGRDGLLVDVRNNGGGWTADRLLASLMVQRGTVAKAHAGPPRDHGCSGPTERRCIRTTGLQAVANSMDLIV